jgi:hypothetical protein
VAHGALKLVKDAVVLVKITQLGPEVVVDVNGLHGLALHIDVPNLQRHIISRENEAPISAEPDIRDGGYDLGEEGFGRRVLGLLEN